MATKAPGLSGAGILNSASPVPKGPSAAKPMKKPHKALGAKAPGTVKKATTTKLPGPKPPMAPGPGALTAGTPGVVNGHQLGTPGALPK